MVMQTAPVAALDIVGTGLAVVQAFSSQLQAQGVELPPRVGLVPGGLTAYDGQQLSVMFMGITLGRPSAPVAGIVNPQNVEQYYEWEVTLLRSAAIVDGTGRSPSADTLTGDFARFAADAEALWAAMVTIHASYTLVPPGVPLLYGPMVSVGPEGGLAGNRLPLAFSATRALGAI